MIIILVTISPVAAVYASEIISTFDIDKPEIRNLLYAKYGDQGRSFFGFVELLGFSTETAQDTFTHYEEDFKWRPFHSKNAVGAPGAGNPQLITLDPSDLDSGNRFFPRRNDQVMYKDGTNGLITLVDTTTLSAPILTISPVNGPIPAVAAGQTIIIISASFSEGSDQPASVVTGTVTYSNDVQIIKETMTATGTEMTNQKWFDIFQTEQGGQKITAYYLKGQMDTDFRMAKKIDGALMFGQRGNGSLIDPDTGRPYKFTEGFVPFIRGNGLPINVTPGNFTISKFDAASKQLDKNWVSKNICLGFGFDLNTDVENSMTSFFNFTEIDYVVKEAIATMFGGQEGKYMEVGFSAMKKSQYHYFFKKMGLFSDQTSFGAPGYTTPGLGLVFPIGRMKDKKNDRDVPTFGVRYKKLGDYSRKFEVWSLSGAGPGMKVLSRDVHNYYMRAHVGFEGIAGNQMCLFNPVTL